jgi:adenosylmethionine-8-amino-7-oxononanoate aminotransferase
LERTIKYEGPESISAFIAEPIIGATAGAVVPKENYWKRIREICDTYNILLIADEVMVGIGRTGKNFCIEHWDVIPDIIVTAKGLSGGYTPVGAVIVKQKIHDLIRDKSGQFVHGLTFSQNPLSMAVGSEVLKYIKDKKLVERVAELGPYFLEKLKELKNLDYVGDVRGLGLIAGIEFVKNKKTKEPFNPGIKFSKKVAEEAFRNGLITYPGSGGVDGVKGDHILLCPPYIIEKDEICEMVSIIKKAIRKVSKII